MGTLIVKPPEATITTFDYQFPGDTNGVIYYLGSEKGRTSFSNPHDKGYVIATSSTSIDVRTPDKAFDRDNNAYTSCWHSFTHSTIQWHKTEFVGRLFRCTRFTLWESALHPFSIHQTTNMIIQGSNDNTTWTDLLTFIPVADGQGRWDSGVFTNTTFYKYYRIYDGNRDFDSFAVLGDIEFYGQLTRR